jgi:hypothetical protein
MPVYNESEDRWNLFYVAYRAKPKTEKAWYVNHEGRIWRAVSTVPGRKGLGGPYKDIGVILEPGSDSDAWEGLQGTDSFFPYQTDSEWYAFYGSAQTEVQPCVFWSVGLVRAPALTGPWKRRSELNPIDFGVNFAENPVVTRIDKNLYVAVLDCHPGKGDIAFSTSPDGIHWTDAGFLNFSPGIRKWWTNVRTPFGLILEKDDVYTLFFAAFMDKINEGVGLVRLKLQIK